MANTRSNPRRSLTIDPRLLTTPAAENDLSIKPHPTLPLAIVNYTNHFSFSFSFSRNKAWDDLSLAARSLVIETTTGRIISRSLPKFFNYHEKFAYKPTGNEYKFLIEQKIDGSLISLFNYREEWMVVSRSAFDSPHATAARRVLDVKYPGVLGDLDKEKTYVFELVDPALPVKVRYEKEDLYLLAIVSRDGSEQPYHFDFESESLPLPFSRPRIHDVTSVIPKQLSQLNLPNEEGFVVKSWASPEDKYPERVKVKFERYLLGGPLFDSDNAAAAAAAAVVGDTKKKNKKKKSKQPPLSLGSELSPSPSSSSTVPISPPPPSNAWMLDTYTKHRLKIHHLSFTSTTSRSRSTTEVSMASTTMQTHKRATLLSLRSIADDYGGQRWLDKIGAVWDRIDAVFALQEEEVGETIGVLRREGFRSDVANASADAKAEEVRKRFERRVGRRGGGGLPMRELLWAWYLAWPAFRQVGCFVERVEVPRDLRSPDVIGMVLDS